VLFGGSALRIGILKGGGSPYLSRWTSEGLFPLRPGTLSLRGASGRSLGPAGQSRAPERSLKDGETLAGTKSKKTKSGSCTGLLGLGRTAGSLPTARAAIISP